MTDQELKERPYKGTWGRSGYCNSEGCNNPAEFYHYGGYADRGNNRWYCPKCARKINEAAGLPICRKGY